MLAYRGTAECRTHSWQQDPWGYETLSIRLLVIGRETHGWWGEWDDEFSGDRLAWLRLNYCRFERGKHYRRTPFFQAASKLQQLLNPASDPFDFMWLNLFICDQNKGLPSKANAESLRKISLLREEISILRPDAVIFFTGPASIWTIEQEPYFPDAEFQLRSPKWWTIAASGLPERAVLTYHPKYLRMSKGFGVLEEIAEWMKQKSPDSGDRANRFIGRGLDGIKIIR